MYISVDIGGTNTRVASSQDLVDVYKFKKFSTKSLVREQTAELDKAITEICDGEDVEGMFIGVPGVLDISKKVFVNLPNYKVLNGHSFNELVPARLKETPYFMINDAALAGYAEVTIGAGKDYGSVLYLTIGTGVGGSFFADKDIQNVYKTFEPGHEIVFKDGFAFEHHVSGKAFKRLYKVSPNDNTAQGIWFKYAQDLGYGILQLKKKVTFDVLILGGGFSVYNFKFFYPHLQKFLQNN